jgi:hypothetical protein
MKLEAVDPKHPSYFCVVTVAEVKGARLRLHFDGWSESYDFWANADSEFIFPVNWCSRNGQVLHPPRSEYTRICTHIHHASVVMYSKSFVAWFFKAWHPTVFLGKNTSKTRMQFLLQNIYSKR